MAESGGGRGDNGVMALSPVALLTPWLRTERSAGTMCQTGSTTNMLRYSWHTPTNKVRKLTQNAQKLNKTKLKLLANVQLQIPSCLNTNTH